MDGCPSEETIVELLGGRLDAGAKRALLEHVDACADCRTLIAAATVDLSAPPSHDGGRPAILPRGAAVGRYRVLEIVGAGAMGVVYAAHDPELGRRVALKLLRADAQAAGPGDERRVRLVREAQALARLAHPNVITVHDVGTHDGQVFLAMELVDGETLRVWLSRARRSQSEIVGAFRQAGEGLAAAHAAGLIHRDFKPDNVLVGRDGRVRVTDFGLARTAGAVPEMPPAAEGPHPLGETVTKVGALVGTPAYMAPEQLAGAPADARSDQFAFAVALYEALHGERPFAGDDLAALARVKQAGDVRPPPRGAKVAPRLRRALLRGLHASPGERWPSMEALLGALDERPFWARRRALGAAAVALAAVLVPALVALRSAGAPTCGGAEHAWGDVWAAPERDAARAAFDKSARPGAGFAFAAVDRALGAYRNAWIDRHTEACQATRVRREQSEAMLEQRLECLEASRREAAALARLLGEADGAVVDRAVDAASSLPRLDACESRGALGAVAPPPGDPAQRAAIARLETRLAEARVLALAGKVPEGLAVAAPAADEARGTGYRALEARLLLVRGGLEYEAGQGEAAARSLHAAAGAALEARDEGTAADAWTLLVRVAVRRQGRADEARRWAEYAEAALRRRGGDDAREAARRYALGMLAWSLERRLDEARGHFTMARDLAARSLGPEHPSVAAAEIGLGNVLFDSGRPDEALAAHRRAGALLERAFGPGSPRLHFALADQGVDLLALDRVDEGLALLSRVVDSAARACPECDDAFFRHRLAYALRRKGDARRALDEDRRALATMERLGATDEDRAWPLAGEGLDLLALGQPKEAVAPLEKAVLLREKGRSTPELLEARLALSRAREASAPAPPSPAAPPAARMPGAPRRVEAAPVDMQAPTVGPKSVARRESSPSGMQEGGPPR